MKRLTGKQLTILGVSLAVILLVGGGYLFYAKVFGNAAKIKLYETAVPGYEWQDIAADNNIVSDYLWSRTKKLMLSDGSILIPSSYMIEGRLVTQEAEVEALTRRLNDGIVASAKTMYLCTQISNSNDYGKDLCKWRRAGSEPAAQCE